MTKRKWIQMGTAIGLTAGLWLGCTHVPSPVKGVHQGRLEACRRASNCVCSEDTGLDSFVDPWPIEGAVQDAWRRLIETLESERGVTLVSRSETYLFAECRTRWLRFVDDLEFRLDESARVIHVRSASRVGYSDLGVNRRRVEQLRERWLSKAPLPASRP